MLLKKPKQLHPHKTYGEIIRNDKLNCWLIRVYFWTGLENGHYEYDQIECYSESEIKQKYDGLMIKHGIS